MKPHFTLIKGNYAFIFSVPPQNLRISTGQGIKNINLIDFGEKVNIGERNVDRITFETFLPNPKSVFYKITNPLLPTAGVNMLKKWQTNKETLTFIVPELLIFYKCNITNLDYSIDDMTGDITVALTLVEKRQQNQVTDSITNLYPRL